MAEFFHGAETVIVNTGSAPVKTVATSVIALIGTAPKGAINTPILVTNPQGAEQFGGDLFPTSINRALKSIFAQGNAPVIVINVFDPATMGATVTDAPVTIANGKGDLGNAILLAPTAPVVTDSTGTTTYTLGTDYTISEYGIITMIPSGAISEGDALLVDLVKLGAAPADSAIIGTVAGQTRTGMKLLSECFDTFGFNPKIIIAPDYSTSEAVAIEMEAQAETFRGMALVEGAIGASVATHIADRTTSGKSFNSTSRRLVACAPRQKAYDFKGELTSYGYSSWVAGIMAKTDRTEGYWVSPSNHTIKGVSASEYVMIGSGINDPSSDANLLNAAGIVTTLKVGGSLRTWGNRSASYPTDTDVRNFIPVQRTQDIIHESLELAKLPFMDKPIITATIDAIKGTANAFISTLIQRGALLAGSEVTYSADDNSAAELAMGHVQFRLTFMPPTPAERITYLSYIDISLLTNLS